MNGKLLGYRGASPIDTGMIYASYIPLQAIRVHDDRRSPSEMYRRWREEHAMEDCGVGYFRDNVYPVLRKLREL